MRRNLLDTVCRADDERVAEAQEQAGLEDADHRLEPGIQLFGVGDSGELAVDDRVAAVGQDESPLGSGRMLVSAPSL